MKKTIVVSGLPRSGTSLMMRLLDVSGYETVRDLNFEKALGEKRFNPYFYEEKNYVKGEVDDYKKIEGKAIKVIVWGLKKIESENVKVIWIDRKKEKIINSWKRYDRQKSVNSINTEEEDYNLFIRMKKNQLPRFEHQVISFEELMKNSKKELEKLNKIRIDITEEAIKEINPNISHI
jgi:RNase adaptor protein for sRNA GlmZ degradation